MELPARKYSPEELDVLCGGASRPPRSRFKGRQALGLFLGSLALACSGDRISTPIDETVISITVTASTSDILNPGDFRLFSAEATYSDGSIDTVTSNADWTTSEPSVMMIWGPGSGRALDAGTTEICADYQTAVDCVAVDVLALPPFPGTAFLNGDIIVQSDPTALDSLEAEGQGLRSMFDRRFGGLIKVEAWLFRATYLDGLDVEVLVNPEFDSHELASTVAKRYAEIFGRLPTGVRRWVETLFIHRGVEAFAGGINFVVIHTGQAGRYSASGHLEEVLFHEATHTSLGHVHDYAAGWKSAQNLDHRFISNYAQDYPYREDVAESFLPYFAVRYRSDRIPQALADTVLQAIPNRIAYFDLLDFDADTLSWK